MDKELKEIAQQIANNTDLRRHTTNCPRFVRSDCNCFILEQAKIAVVRKFT